MIHVVGILDYPVIAHYAGQAFATRGVRVDWYPRRIINGRLDNEVSGFYSAVFANPALHERPIEDPDGNAAFCRLTPAGPIIAASLPRTFLKGRWHEARRVKRFLRRSDGIVRVVSESVSNHLVRQAAVHGIANHIANIRSACEAMSGVDRENRFVRDILRSSLQIGAVLEAGRVFSPDFKIGSDDPYNSIHPLIMLQVNAWRDHLNDRQIWVSVSECYKQVRMDNGLAVAMVANMFSNMAKYGRRQSTVNVTFDSTEDMFAIVFSMESRVIKQDEVERIKQLGERGQTANAAGDGVGLALINQVLLKYGGRLEIEAGVSLADSSEFAKNTFRFILPSRLVRDDLRRQGY